MADPDIPPADGQRASVAPDGAVRGTGTGAGGGQPGEDYDDDAASGDGYPLDGGEDQADTATREVDPARGALRPRDGDR